MKKLSLFIIATALAFSLVSCRKDTESFTLPSLVAHAGGAAYGYRLTNSLEALDAAYEGGHRLIELDFEITSDKEYVLLHDWDSMAERMLGKSGQLTCEQFLSSDSFMGLTLLDLDSLTKWMKKHPDAYIVTDAKCDNIPFLERISESDVRDRFIPQVYDFEEYDSAVSLGFEKVILTLYRLIPQEERIISFAREKAPVAITMPESYITEDLLLALKDAGVPTYLHTVNDLSLYEKYREMGLYGIYTDYFVPNKWEY